MGLNQSLSSPEIPCSEAGYYKIVISGPPGAGKTTFVKTISETDVINTDEIASDGLDKRMTTVAFDYGTRKIGEYYFYLFGTPGQERFNFMWNILCKGALGLLFLVNGTRYQDFSRARTMLDYIVSQVNTPFVIGVSHQDEQRTWNPHEVAMYFRLPPSQVFAVDARDEKSSLRLLLEMLYLIQANQNRVSKQTFSDKT